VILGQPDPLAVWGQWDEAAPSEILGCEARRPIERSRFEATIRDEDVAALQQALARVDSTIATISLTRAVLRRAALPMATLVKPADVIHLASTMLFHEHGGAALPFAAHDAREAIAARALGFECTGANLSLDGFLTGVH